MWMDADGAAARKLFTAEGAKVIEALTAEEVPEDGREKQLGIARMIRLADDLQVNG